MSKWERASARCNDTRVAGSRERANSEMVPFCHGNGRRTSGLWWLTIVRLVVEYGRAVDRGLEHSEHGVDRPPAPGSLPLGVKLRHAERVMERTASRAENAVRADL